MSADENILARFIEDRESLSEPEFDGLVAALKADPILSRTLKDLLVVDDMCGQHLSPDRRGFKAQIAQRLKDLREGRHWEAGELVKQFKSRPAMPAASAGTRFWAWGTLAAAAGVAIVATLIVAGRWNRLEHLDVQVAAVGGAPAELHAQRGGKDEVLTQGAAVLSGETIANRGDADAEFALTGEDSHIVLHEDSSLKFHAEPGGTRIELTEGSLSAKVAPHEPGHPLVFATAQAEAAVLGTELKLSVEEGTTRLEVTHGRVQVTRKEDGETIMVEAGKFATVAPGRELVAKAVAAASTATTAMEDLPTGYTASPWRKLFDGATLNGWTQDKGHWIVKNGVIAGQTRVRMEQAALMSTETFGDFELRFAYYVDGNAYLEFRHRVTDAGCFQYEAKEKNHRAWRQCVVRVIGAKGEATIDGRRVPYAADGAPVLPGHLRFYVQNRGLDIETDLKVKDIEVRTLQRAAQP
ncbi:MAG: DUF1080 domain-containing protein [Planctomycetes bacterium]|nr:DUF1080 domain-containing protein [Planctomycetota bacterium]